MAVLRNQNGILKGRVGNVVYQRMPNSKTFVRAYVDKIANPKTTAQILRRCRMLPASAVYSKMQEIFNHSQGARPWISHQSFMRHALLTNIYPYLPKGYSGAAVAGEYKVSEGPLFPLTYAISNNAVVSNIQISANTPQGATWGEICADPANNDLLAIGDQLSLIINWLDEDGNSRWLAQKWSIDADARPESYFQKEGTLLSIQLEQILPNVNTPEIICGAFVRTSFVAGEYKYSDEFFSRGEGFQAYVDALSYNAMIASYQDASSATVMGSSQWLKTNVGNLPSQGKMPAKAATLDIKAYGGGTVWDVVGVPRHDGLYLLVHEVGSDYRCIKADGEFILKGDNQYLLASDLDSGQFVGNWIGSDAAVD